MRGDRAYTPVSPLSHLVPRHPELPHISPAHIRQYGRAGPMPGVATIQSGSLTSNHIREREAWHRQI
jgi:hypothetical protein